MQSYLTQISNYLFTQSWQIAILVVIIAILNWFLKNKSAHVRYLLWMIVLAKCLMPPLVTIPVAILPEQSTLEQTSTIPVIKPTIATENTSVPEEPVRQFTTGPEFSEPIVTKKTITLTPRQWLGIAWLIGIVIYTTVVLTKALRTEIWLRRKKKPLPDIYQVRIEDLFYKLKLKKFPKIWLVEGIGQPFVWGTFRGSIYLPCDFIKINNGEQLQAILGHELSHIIRLDIMINLLQIITQGIFWFHPFVWLANKNIRAEREKCCDEMTIAHLGTQTKVYSKAIVNILISEYKNNTQNISSLAIVGPVKNIEERIKTMLKPGKIFYKRPSIISITAVFLIALIVVPTALVLTACAEINNSSLKTSSTTALLKEGKHAEEVEHNFDKAIQIYQEVITASEQTSADAAQATYGIGSCYLKKGEISPAMKYFYELSAFPGQESLAKEARKQLDIILKPPASNGPKPPIQVGQLENSKILHLSKEAGEQFKRTNPPIGERAMIHRSVYLTRIYTPAIIDGIAENIWSGIPQEMLGNKIASSDSPGKSVSAIYKAMWDNDNLYVFVHVSDEARQSDSADFTQDDSIEIFLDADNSKTGDYDNNDYHFYFKWNEDNPVIGLASDKTVPDGIQYKVVSFGMNTGYNLEVMFPWEAIGTKAYPNAKIGFDIHVNDDDNGGDRDYKITWCDRGDLAWQNTCLFGTAELTGLVGCWKFDETEGTIANDSSGNGNYGKLIGDAKWQPSDGKSGGAIYLDGDRDYVIITNAQNFNITEAITVCAWVKTDPVNDNWATIIGKGNSWHLYSGFPEDQYYFQINNMTPSNPREFKAGQWHHVAGVYDSKNLGEVRIYIDGKFDVSRQSEQIISPSTEIRISDLPVCIGENLQTGGREWKGLIDDVRIYNYTLSDSEIEALYNGK